MSVADTQILEIANAVWKAGRRRLAGELYSIALYRRLALNFPKTQAPQNDLPCLLAGDAQRGDDVFQGNFSLAGIRSQYTDAHELWRKPVPSRRFAARLHEFGWLHDLMALQNADAINLAGHHVDHWIGVYGQWNPFSWAPGLVARRCLNWLSYGRSLLGAGDDGMRRRDSLIRQIVYLHTLGDIASKTHDRLQIALALIATGVLLKGAEDYAEPGLEGLSAHLAEQILPDGGHVSRNPEMAATTLCDLVALRHLLESHGRAIPDDLERALSRLAPMVRFLCAADGHLSAFNGGGEGLALTTKQILKDLNIPESAFTYAPHSGYQRVKTDASVLIMDTGRPPPEAYSQNAHAGALAFELSTPGGRLVVNCGWSEDQPDQWHLAVRTSAAHSTLVINDTSSAQIRSDGIRAILLGPRLRQRGLANPSRRKIEPGLGTHLEASHGGYLHRYGLIHQREILVSEDGTRIAGNDRVFRPREIQKTSAPARLICAVRFHLHPKVRASFARDETQTLLVLPDGTGWRFQCETAKLTLQPSVYLAAGAPPERTQQLVVHFEVDSAADITNPQNHLHWSIEKV